MPSPPVGKSQGRKSHTQGRARGDPFLSHHSLLLGRPSQGSLGSLKQASSPGSWPGMGLGSKEKGE